MATRVAHARPFERHLLATYHAVAGLRSPSDVVAIWVGLVLRASQPVYFPMHHLLGQFREGGQGQIHETLLRQRQYFGQRERELNVFVGCAGLLAKLLSGALLIDLISFFHCDSPLTNTV